MQNLTAQALQRIMLIREAQASVALDHDLRAQTLSFGDLTPEQQRKYGPVNG